MFNDLQSLQDLVKFLQKHCTLDVLSLKYFRIQDRFFVFSMQTLVVFPCHVALSSRMRTYLNLYLFDSKPVKPGSYSIMRSRTCGIFSWPYMVKWRNEGIIWGSSILLWICNLPSDDSSTRLVFRERKQKIWFISSLRFGTTDCVLNINGKLSQGKRRKRTIPNLKKHAIPEVIRKLSYGGWSAVYYHSASDMSGSHGAGGRGFKAEYNNPCFKS